MAHPSPDGTCEIRIATDGETAAAVATLVAAFVADPITRFAWPSAHDYLRGMPLLTHAFGGRSFAHDAALVSSDLAGAALWLPPGVQPDGEALVRLVQETAEPSRQGDLLATYAQIGESHPKEPHWYLPLVGVDPSAQGRGIGGALMRRATARCDEAGMLAYLESSNPRNISLYERHGFEVVRTIQAGAAPVVTPMLRRPRSQ